METAIEVKKKKLRPLYDRALIKVIVPKEQSQNGIYIPDVAVERPLEGEVIAVGSGRVENGERIPLDLKVGDFVLFGRYSGNAVTVDGESMLLLNEDEIQGVWFED